MNVAILCTLFSPCPRLPYLFYGALKGKHMHTFELVQMEHTLRDVTYSSLFIQLHAVCPTCFDFDLKQVCNLAAMYDTFTSTSNALLTLSRECRAKYPWRKCKCEKVYLDPNCIFHQCSFSEIVIPHPSRRTMQQPK